MPLATNAALQDGQGSVDESTSGSSPEQSEETFEPGREVSDTMLRKIEEFFAAWRNAVAEGKDEELLQFYDARAIYQRSHALAPLESLAEPRLVLQLVEKLAADLLVTERIAWDTVEILDAEIGEESHKLVVTTRATRTVEDVREVRLQRWLLATTANPWQLNDRVDLHTGVALSWGATRYFSDLPEAPQWTHHVDNLLRGAKALRNEDLEGVAWGVKALADVELPDAMAGTLSLMRARNALEGERYESAILWLEKARKLLPNVPSVTRTEAFARAAKGDWERALAAAREFSSEFTGDAELCFVEGQAAAALGRLDEATTAFRAGLATAPQSVDNLLGLARAMGPEGEQELRDRFRRLNDPAAWFEPLVLQLFETGDLDDVGALIDELRNIAPADPNGDYYEATLLMQRGLVRDAADLLRDAFPKVADPVELRFYVEQYVDACVLLNEPMEAYKNAPDSPYVFDLLCSYLLEVGQTAQLEELAMRHELNFPEDPWLPYYRGELLRNAGDLSAAALRFEEGFLNAKDADTREVYRWNLVRARIEAGEALRAYAEIEPRDATYQQITLHSLESGDAELLDQILTARRTDAPDDPKLPLLDGVRMFWRGDYDGALKRLQGARDSLDPDEPELMHVERALILAALRSGALDIAEREARASTQRDGDPLFEAIVHAARGQHDRTLTALNTCLRLGYEAETFYGDPDLGPTLLTHAAYAEFRVSNPPASTDAGEG